MNTRQKMLAGRPLRPQALQAYNTSVTANQLRKLLESYGLSQSAAARELGIHPRTVRKYVLGELPVPRIFELALLQVIAQRKGEKR